MSIFNAPQVIKNLLDIIDIMYSIAIATSIIVIIMAVFINIALMKSKPWLDRHFTVSSIDVAFIWTLVLTNGFMSLLQLVIIISCIVL